MELEGKADLPSLTFTDAFFDEKSAKWYICAYILKDEFLKISLNEVQSGIKKAETAITNLKKLLNFHNLSASPKFSKVLTHCKERQDR